LGYNKIPIEHYFDAIEIFRHLLKGKDYLIRIEQSSCNIYSNNRKYLISLGNKVHHKYASFYEPDPKNIAKLTSNQNIIITKTPPEFEYIITLGKKRGNTGLANWLQANPKLGKMGKIALEECRSQGWVKGYYFYVKNEKVLNLVMMIVGDNIQRIDKMVQSS